MKKYLFFLLITLLVQSGPIMAQSTMPQPFIYDPDVLVLMEAAKKQMQEGNYEEANKTFRKVLATNRTLPTEMSYLFAETLFVINQYQNSKNFVNKYIDLAGKGGDYYDKAIDLRNMLDDRFNEIRNCDYCNLSGYRYVVCDNCDGAGHSIEVCYQCKANGLTTCPKCIGNGVLISLNTFGDRQYESCDRCDSRGYIICTVCNGDKHLSGTCNVCLGSGQKVSSQICNHEHSQ